MLDAGCGQIREGEIPQDVGMKMDLVDAKGCVELCGFCVVMWFSCLGQRACNAKHIRCSRACVSHWERWSFLQRMASFACARRTTSRMQISEFLFSPFKAVAVPCGPIARAHTRGRGKVKASSLSDEQSVFVVLRFFLARVDSKYHAQCKTALRRLRW